MSPSQRISSRPPPPPGLPGPGDTIADKYVVERLLGVGGMGAVLAARHVELDERVAIKMLLPTVKPEGDPVTRFIREAKAAIKIRNEHVVRVLDVARLPDGSPYIVMEYLEGTDLSRLTEEVGPLPVEDAVEYVVQACEAIAAAHALGIVHRDLKPANLFLTRTGDGRPCVKVLDFGISKIGEGGGDRPGLTSTLTVMGTPCFMSPEQLRSTRDVDARADIWSIGAILHALLTGTPPYDGESNADVSAKIIRDAPIPVRSVRPEAPAELEAIILRCLEKEPEARFADVAELAGALAALSLRESVKASAARVVRGTFAAAPTMVSTHPGPAIASGPTRTASAWGDTGRNTRGPAKQRSRWMLAGALGVALVGSVVALGIVRSGNRTSPAVASTGSPAPSLVEGPPATPPPPPAPVPAPSPSVAAALASSAPSQPAPPAPRPAAGGKKAPAAPTAGAAPSAPAKPPGGLFDGRE